MRLPPTPANTLWRALRDDIRGRFPGGRVIVAVDGPAAAAVAAGIAAAFDEADVAVFRAHVEDFLLPRAQRRPQDRYDWALLRRVLTDPFRDGGRTSATTGFQLTGFDHARDVAVQARWATAAADAVLLIDGPDLHLPDLRAVWDCTVSTGGAARTGGATRADLVVDMSDPARPARVEAAS